MTPLVIEYLRTHTFKQLEIEHGVYTRPTTDFNKTSLNYDMIDAKPTDELACQCRGLVIRTQFQLTEETWSNTIPGECTVLAWPLNRFFNLGDGNCAPVNWSNTIIYEKLDGTMIVLYWDPKPSKWCVGTRAVCEADLPVSLSLHTFSDLFWMSLGMSTQLSVEQVCDALQKDVTYVFELTTPVNQVVVLHKDYRVTLLATRHTQTGVESLVGDHAKRLGVATPRVWELKSPADIEKFVDDADPKVLEGAVVCDIDFNRIKVKNKSYVLASKAKDSISSSPRNAIEIILRKKADDIVSLLDDITAKTLLTMQDNVRTVFQNIDKTYVDCLARSTGADAKETRKNFAINVMSSGVWYSPLFAMYEKKALNVRDYIDKLIDADKLTPSILDSVLTAIKDI